MSSNTKTISSTSSLLPAKPTTTTEPQPIPFSSRLMINGLAIGRFGLGVSSLLAPTFTFGLFKMPIPAAMTVLPRLFGIREIMVGEMLWTAENTRETKRALWMNMGVDAVDLLSVGYGVATGTIPPLPAGFLLAGGAAMCLTMGGWGMRGCMEA